MRKYIPPMSMVLFLALTLAGTYYVRLKILERHMVAAMEMCDEKTFAELAFSWPCPVGARQETTDATPLHSAACFGREDVAERLISRGLPVDRRDSCGGTALQTAACLGKTKMVAFLISRGADVNTKEKFDYTPLHRAANWQRGDTVLALLDRGAEMEARDFEGRTPLFNAAMSIGYLPNDSGFEALLARGADINARDAKGWTALHYASRFGYWQIVKKLLPLMKDVNAKDNSGKTPLALALLGKDEPRPYDVKGCLSREEVKEKYEKTLAILREAGAKE